MKDNRLHVLAYETVEGLVGAETYSFTRGWEAARIGGKWFMLITHHDGHDVLILKAPPEDVVALQRMYDEVTPGYHMNKKHWFTVRAGEGISEETVVELIVDSYRTVKG